ncbi:hypothetical protein BDU57DRAFT_571128 [Ampelomyces quisqualis]|uniref:Uncharacterized protein n=1 Tax=Ampelomyces quisqualis TaxID=50730 RepID=A0A6A5QPF9_AMPQU|nr:hypothetical protein BDU57DRAFT_571128 [Ampelomyces quisqualis]
MPLSVLDYPDKHSFLIEDHQRPVTRTFPEAVELHERAAANFKHVLGKLRSVPSSARPTLGEYYRGNAEVTCAPEARNIYHLCGRWNDITSANFMANSNLDAEANELIFYYGLDTLHSFSHMLNQSRLNIVLAIFVLASKLIGKYDSRFDRSESLWGDFIFAWIESIVPEGVTEFQNRERFLKAWHESKFDLTFFINRHRKRLAQAIADLSIAQVPIKGDPLEFLAKCHRKEITMDEFLQYGPAMCIHFVISKKKQARIEMDKANESKIAHAAEMERLRAQTAEAEKELAEEDGFYQFDDEDDEDVEMGGISEPIPDNIDLTRVPWDVDWMQGLLNIDKDMEAVASTALTSDRTPWIDSAEGFDMFLTREAKVPTDLMKALNIW